MSKITVHKGTIHTTKLSSGQWDARLVIDHRDDLNETGATEEAALKELLDTLESVVSQARERVDNFIEGQAEVAHG
jgi:hypothetical protein